MSRLLNAGFSRLFKSFSFRICVIFSAAVSLLSVLTTFLDVQANPEYYENPVCVDSVLFSHAIFITIAAAAFVSVFLGSEYSDGTIRSKLTVGHVRAEIFLSDFIVCSAGSVIMFAVNTVLTLVAGVLLLDGIALSAAEVITLTLSGCLAMVSLTALLVFIAVMIQAKSAATVVSLITAFVMIFAGLIINQMLLEPEYVTEYVFSGYDEETGTAAAIAETSKNPFYLSGKKREVFIFFNDLLPDNQLMQIIPGNENVDIPAMTVCSCALILFMNGLGIVLFRKKDIK